LLDVAFGAVYTRFGHHKCKDEAKLVYQGSINIKCIILNVYIMHFSFVLIYKVY